MNARCFNEDILLNRNEGKRIIHVIDLLFCSLPQVLGIKGLVFVAAIVAIHIGHNLILSR